MMGRHPTELISSLSEPSIQNKKLKDILDSRIPLLFSRKDMQEIVLIVTLALACLSPHPKSRPSMQEIASELLVSKPPLLWHFDGISIHQLMKQKIYIIGRSQESNIKNRTSKRVTLHPQRETTLEIQPSISSTKAENVNETRSKNVNEAKGRKHK